MNLDLTDILVLTYSYVVTSIIFFDSESKDKQASFLTKMLFASLWPITIITDLIIKGIELIKKEVYPKIKSLYDKYCNNR